MNYTQLIPLVSDLLTLGIKIANMIERAEDISDQDKESMKVAIQAAKARVTAWDPTTAPPLT
jgi:hypothetical protein